jgi:putative copper export protein
MAAILGGALVTWAMFRLAPPPSAATPDETAIAGARSYEWVFWSAVGLLVVTGIGNLGMIAPAVPVPASRWGRAFTAKLLGLIGLLVLSFGRASVLVGWETGRLRARPAHRALRLGYGLTALLAVGLLAIAEVLAHG